MNIQTTNRSITHIDESKQLAKTKGVTRQHKLVSSGYKCTSKVDNMKQKERIQKVKIVN